MTGEEHHDVVVVGGGVAGLNCALECFDIQLDTILVDAGAALGGQVSEILHSVRNVAAGRFTDGLALQRALLEASDILGDRVRRSHPVTKADLDARAVEVDGCRLSGQALVVATGTTGSTSRPRPTEHSAETSRTSSSRSCSASPDVTWPSSAVVTARRWMRSSSHAAARPSSWSTVRRTSPPGRTSSASFTHPERVSVEPRALVVRRHVRETVGGLERELLEDLHRRTPGDWLMGVQGLVQPLRALATGTIVRCRGARVAAPRGW